MAREWLKWVKGLENRPEVLRIARAVKLTRWDVACRCMVAWSWADDESEDGIVHGATLVDLDDLVGKRGFAAAMQAADWVAVEGDSLAFPNWDRHNSETAKARALDTERKRKERGQISDNNGTTNGHHRDKSVTRKEEKRREEKNPPSPPKGGEVFNPWKGTKP